MRRGELVWIRLRGERVRVRAADPARDEGGEGLVRLPRFGLLFVHFTIKDAGPSRVRLDPTGRVIAWAELLAVVVEREGPCL